MNKCNSKDIETTVRKSEGAYYRGHRVTPAEGRPLGEIDLRRETSWVHPRPH
jgi:hypothetical protein